MSDRSKKARTTVEAATGSTNTPTRPVVPIVALGASAGGLRALEAFLKNVSANSGFAYVLAMHLSAEYESQLSQILQVFSAIPVSQVNAITEIRPNHVYVIAPGRHLTVRDGRLLVSQRDLTQAAGVIDHLFRSLAEDREELAIGIVFSGSGADGTIGLQAIKERGGLLFAQSPAESEYAAMPRSIIATGLVDFVLPAADMPAQLVALKNRAPSIKLPRDRSVWPESHAKALQVIFTRLRSVTGFDFSHYKRASLLRQFSRRMLVLHSKGLPEYAARVEDDEVELKTLFRNLLVGVTHFFRDPEAFGVVQREVIPRLFQEIPVDSTSLRVWVAGCATGEEAYSLAMLLVEYREDIGSSLPIQVLATDIDDAALSIARRGVYADTVTAGLSPERLKRFFIAKEGAYQVSDELRALVVFASHDITRDPPFARIDLLSCRNLLIYFEAGMQLQVLERCAYSLRPGGILFLGTAEGTGRASSLFTALPGRRWLYRRSRTTHASSTLDFLPVSRAFPMATGSSTPNPGRSSRLAMPSLPTTGVGPDRPDVLPNDPDKPEVPRTVGDLEQSNDELTRANQEMQSLNEELRSMVEEIEVAKEEMQSLNEELTTVNQELQHKVEEHRRVNSDLHLLIESTQMATLFLDPNLNVLLYTPESTKLFNLLPIDIGRPLEHLSHRLTYAEFLHDARLALDHGTETEREVQAQDGSWYMMRVMPYEATPVSNGGVVLTFADISSQKRVEQASIDRFSLAFHAGPMAASIVSQDDGRILEVNSIFERITGYMRSEVIGHVAMAIDLAFTGAPELAEVVDSPPSGGVVMGDLTVQIRNKSGELRDLVVSTTEIEYNDRPCHLSLFHDVTERMQLEREILRISDREQRRIGVDLHDGLGTHLTGVALMTRGLARNVRAKRPISAEELDEIARLIGDGIEQARTLAHGLNPFVLEVRGLAIALQELAADLQSRSGIDCTFVEDGTAMPIELDRATHLYRIVQEALTNAVRHAHASHIRITLHRKDLYTRLTIRDDGIGFDAAQVSSPGMGLSIMRYRAEIIGARLSVSATPGGGTTVTCSFRLRS